MDIVNYVQKLVSDFGRVNPAEKVVSDVSAVFVKMKRERKVRKRRNTIKPVFKKAFSDITKTYNPYSVKNPHPIRPDDHHAEAMHLKGWLDLDLDDPDLAPLFKL